MAGQQVPHPRWGVGHVLTVEGTGSRQQAQIEFGDLILWVVLEASRLTIIRKGARSTRC